MPKFEDKIIKIGQYAESSSTKGVVSDVSHTPLTNERNQPRHARVEIQDRHGETHEVRPKALLNYNWMGLSKDPHLFAMSVRAIMVKLLWFLDMDSLLVKMSQVHGTEVHFRWRMHGTTYSQTFNVMDSYIHAESDAKYLVQRFVNDHIMDIISTCMMYDSDGDGQKANKISIHVKNLAHSHNFLN